MFSINICVNCFAISGTLTNSFNKGHPKLNKNIKKFFCKRDGMYIFKMYTTLSFID